MFTSSMVMANSAASLVMTQKDDGQTDDDAQGEDNAQTDDVEYIINQFQTLQLNNDICKNIIRKAFTVVSIGKEYNSYMLKGFIMDNQLYGTMDKKKVNMSLKDVVQVLLVESGLEGNKVRIHLSMKNMSQKIWCTTVNQAENVYNVIPTLLLTNEKKYKIMSALKISCINKCAKYSKEIYLNKLLGMMQDDGLCVRAPSEPQTAVILDYFYNQESYDSNNGMDTANCECDVPENEKKCGKSTADGTKIGQCKKVTVMIHNTGTIKLWGNSNEAMAEAACKCIFIWLDNHQDVVKNAA